MCGHTLIFVYGNTVDAHRGYWAVVVPFIAHVRHCVHGHVFTASPCGTTCTCPCWSHQIQISLLEIYNETIADLLATEPLTSKLTVKRGKNGNYVPGLTTRSVSSPDEVLDIMRRGYKTRTTFATNSNEHSSRSHCMLSVYVVASNKVTDMVARGKLHLVDLAGSERVSKSGVTGARLKEAQAINK